MIADVVMRKYERRDRSAVRRISCDTADRGGPVESIFPDREVAGDLLTRYYTDFEPESLWVAVHEEEVVGYLTGCLKSHRYLWVLMFRVVPQALFRAFFRGSLFRKETGRLLVAGIRTLLKGGFFRKVPLDKYPAHLHVNLERAFRGQKLGRRLVERFVEEVKVAGLGGFHATTRQDNAPTCRFFEQMGLTALGQSPVILPDGNAFRLVFTVTYGKKL